MSYNIMKIYLLKQVGNYIREASLVIDICYINHFKLFMSHMINSDNKIEIIDYISELLRCI